MSIEEIRSHRNAKPFRPFELVLQDGNVLHVAGPERIAIAPWGRLCVYSGSLPYMPHASEVAEVRMDSAASERP